MHNSRIEKVVTSDIEIGLPFMIHDLGYKSQMICLWGSEVIEWKPNAVWTQEQTYMGKLH